MANSKSSTNKKSTTVKNKTVDKKVDNIENNEDLDEINDVIEKDENLNESDNSMEENKNSDEINDVVKENEGLKNEIELLKSQMALMMKSITNNVYSNINNNNDDEDITVISMCNWVLNLTTEPMGAGNIYKFTKFGEEQIIPKDDLKRIVRVNSKFIKEGLVYIADEKFIANEKLGSIYSRILDVDKMKEILNVDKNTFRKTFTSLPKSQQEVLIDLICRKKINNEDVDMNIVLICEEVSGRKLFKEIEQATEILKEIKN